MTADEFKNEILKHVKPKYNNPIILVNNLYGNNASRNSVDLIAVSENYNVAVQPYENIIEDSNFNCYSFVLIAWAGVYINNNGEKISIECLIDTLLIIEKKDYMIYLLTKDNDDIEEFLIKNTPREMFDTKPLVKK